MNQGILVPELGVTLSNFDRGARRCVIAYKFRTSKKPELLAWAFMVAAEGTTIYKFTSSN